MTRNKRQRELRPASTLSVSFPPPPLSPSLFLLLLFLLLRLLSCGPLAVANGRKSKSATLPKTLAREMRERTRKKTSETSAVEVRRGEGGKEGGGEPCGTREQRKEDRRRKRRSRGINHGRCKLKRLPPLTLTLTLALPHHRVSASFSSRFYFSLSLSLVFSILFFLRDLSSEMPGLRAFSEASRPR